MLLSLRILDDVQNVNSFEVVQQAKWTVGDSGTVYFQLVDAAKDREELGFFPGGRRYVPAAGSTLTVTLDNVDDGVKVANRVATQPFSQDGSVWAFNYTSADTISGTITLRITLTQGGVVTRGEKTACCLVNAATP